MLLSFIQVCTCSMYIWCNQAKSSQHFFKNYWQEMPYVLENCYHFVNFNHLWLCLNLKILNQLVVTYGPKLVFSLVLLCTTEKSPHRRRSFYWLTEWHKSIWTECKLVTYLIIYICQKKACRKFQVHRCTNVHK